MGISNVGISSTFIQVVSDWKQGPFLSIPLDLSLSVGASKGRWTRHMLESVRMLLGVVRSDTAQSHHGLRAAEALWRRESESNLTPRCHSLLAWSWRLQEQLPLGFAKACCRWMGPPMIGRLALFTVWSAIAPHCQVILFFFSRTQVCGLLIYEGLGPSSTAFLQKCKLFQCFPLCSSNLDVRWYR